MSMYTSRYPCSPSRLNNRVPLIDAHENMGGFLRDARHKPAQSGCHGYAVDPGILPDDNPRKTQPSYDNVRPGWDNIYIMNTIPQNTLKTSGKEGEPEHLLNRDAIHKPNVPSEEPGDHLPSVILRITARRIVNADL